MGFKFLGIIWLAWRRGFIWEIPAYLPQGHFPAYLPVRGQFTQIDIIDKTGIHQIIAETDWLDAKGTTDSRLCYTKPVLVLYMYMYKH